MTGANRRRGEIVAELDGKVRKLCLTLGALAELEAAYAADDLGALVTRFSRGSLSALDLMRIIAAGLRGAGEDISEEAVSSMQAEGGVTGFARIAAELLAVTFGAPREERSSPNP